MGLTTDQPALILTVKRQMKEILTVKRQKILTVKADLSSFRVICSAKYVYFKTLHPMLTLILSIISYL